MALFRSLKVLEGLTHRSTRFIGSTAVLSNKKNLDPIQELFVNNLAAYKAKSKDGMLVDAGEEVQAKIEKEISQLQRRYGGDAKSLEEFPKFNFAEQ